MCWGGETQRSQKEDWGGYDQNTLNRHMEYTLMYEIVLCFDLKKIYILILNLFICVCRGPQRRERWQMSWAK